jgi:hypothetical protein
VHREERLKWVNNLDNQPSECLSLQKRKKKRSVTEKEKSDLEKEKQRKMIE